jgi:drug/metabolite transporter (DMT)-like permease
MIIIFGVDFAVAKPITFLVLFGSGLVISVANIFFYRAFEIDDSTNVGIFVQSTPVFYLILGWLFLNETISLLQLVAFLIVLSASAIIILTARKKSRRIKMRTAFFILLFVIFDVIGNIMFVKVSSGNLNFLTEIGFVFIGKGIGNGIIVLLKPKWRRRYRSVVKSSKRKVLVPLSCSFLVNIVAESTYRAALVFAPSVALASVISDSAVPIAVFFMGIVFTLIWPKFGREKLDRKSVIVHLIATILVVVGIILIQV